MIKKTFKGGKIFNQNQGITSIILAGGKSARFGRNKVKENIEGEPLLNRVIHRLEIISSEIIIVAAREDDCVYMPKSEKVHCIADVIPSKGSIGGLYTGLSYANVRHSLVVACDMPFLNVSLISYLFQLSPAFDVIIPREAGMVEPLHAVYSENCIPYLKQLIDQDKLSILELYPLVKVRYVEEDELNQFDPDHLSFFNINTETDLEVAKSILKEGKLRTNVKRQI